MKRSELYDRIWSTPASKIADELGISGSRIAVICRRHGIPTPPRGYWAKWTVGKHLPRTPLPQPEADYELSVGAAPPKQSAWVVPGVLIRPKGGERPPQAQRVTRQPQPAAAQPFPPDVGSPPTPGRSPPPSVNTDVDLELVRAAATELQNKLAVEALLLAAASRAMHADSADAQRILRWVATVRVCLEESDPVSAVLQLVTSSKPKGC